MVLMLMLMLPSEQKNDVNECKEDVFTKPPIALRIPLPWTYDVWYYLRMVDMLVRGSTWCKTPRGACALWHFDFGASKVIGVLATQSGQCSKLKIRQLPKTRFLESEYIE